jgi:hypothetical protein
MTVLVCVLLAIVALCVLAWWSCIRMPGESHSGPLPALTAAQREVAAALERDVRALAEEIGERNVAHPAELARAASYIERAFASAGLAPRREEFAVQGVRCANVVAEISAESNAEVVVVGAHYDSVLGSPGANDNASGVAAVLALARRFAADRPPRSIRFVAFVNEEPPWFGSPEMGSWVHAQGARDRGEEITAMLSLETMGCFDDRDGSQRYPVPLLSGFYPSAGNFITFVGNVSSRRLVRQSIASFRRAAPFPSEGAALPALIPGVGWSDQLAFWRAGYPALMVTDTAPFRYPEYHTARDVPDRVDYERLARVVDGLCAVVEELAGLRRGDAR